MKEIPNIHIEAETPQHHRLAWWFENTIVRGIGRIFNILANPIKDIISFAFSNFFSDMENEGIDIIRPYAEFIIGQPNVPDFVKNMMRYAISGSKPAGFIAFLFAIPAAYQIIVSGVSAPMSDLVRATVQRDFRTYLPEPGLALTFYHRHLISRERAIKILRYNGLSEDIIDKYLDSANPAMDDAELSNALWRKTMSKADISLELDKRGMTSQQKGIWFDNRDIIPNPSELISMAVREAFSDATARQFGYDENFPADAAQWAEKGGYSVEWFKRAWRAHWALPGLTQVREMYHRGIVSESVVDQYLLAADIPIFWRDAIKKWMRQEITRVDVRRIYESGLIDEQEVVERYIKLGYSPEDAVLMTQWTALEYQQEERELTKTDILSMYRDRILNEDEATDYLLALDYRNDAIALLLAHQDLKRQEEYESAIITNTKKLFFAGVYDRNDVYDQLGKLDTPGHFIEETLTVWDVEKKASVKTPTLTQLRDMYLAGVITIDTFVNQLRLMGYADVYIGWYIHLWFGEVE